MENVGKEYFKIEYLGGQAKSNELTVRELAPSLLAFADFVEQASKSINGNKVKVDLKFRASEEGSIIVELCFTVNLLSKIADIFRGDAYTAILNLKEVIGIAASMGIGIFKTIKWIKNRNIERVKIKEGKKALLKLEDGGELEISDNELKVLRNIKARKSLSEFAQPIRSGSADNIVLYDKANDKDEENGISKNEIDYFDPPEIPDELVNESKQDLAITIDSLSFKENNKWRVSDGSNNYVTSISDETFLKDIQRNSESFRYDDILKV